MLLSYFCYLDNNDSNGTTTYDTGNITNHIITKACKFICMLLNINSFFSTIYLFCCHCMKRFITWAVEAIPSMSKNIPMSTINKTINKPTTQETLLNKDEEKLEKIAANTSVITAMVKLNLMEPFILSFIYIYLNPYRYVCRMVI